MVDTRKLKNFEFGNATDVGRVREQNEDYLGYFECINGHIFVVCDGMGGHVGGATASRLAVEAAREFLENHYYDLPQDALKDAIEYANEAVYIKAAENPQLQGMGTTIVMVIVRDDKAYYAHVGDSRLYLHSGGKLIKLTRDHSFVQTLVDQGLLKEEEMESHPRRNEILRALGVRNDIEITICKSPAKPTNGDILLLCTDGLNSMITDTVTESVLNEDISIQHKALKLMQLANDAGGYDNITVQLVHFYNVTNKKSDFIPASQVPADEPVLNDSKKKFKLTKKMRKNILYVVVGIAVLAIAYFMWDMFGGGGKPDPMTVGGKDTVKSQGVDTTHQPGAPVENAVVKVSNDTIWADYEVKSGDVLGKICTKFNVKLAILKKKNKLKSDNVKVGDKLWVPVKAEHVVASGETIDGIAKKYESEKTAILTANGLKSPTDMKVGKTLLVPYTR
jgi:serine/threonine protein phosphatase PrpC/LysM repeat protein